MTQQTLIDAVHDHLLKLSAKIVGASLNYEYYADLLQELLAEQVEGGAE